METSAASAAPQAIGPFRIVRSLGQGAMGTVYLAERTGSFAQSVAIKRLHPHVSLLLGEQHLHHEKAVLTSLDHPGIVRLLDTRESSGLPCIVMEYVDGKPLDVFCREHQLAVLPRVHLLLKIADALDYAHRRLVIHSDLKPENILVASDSQPRLLDFGVAEWISPARTNPHHTPFFTPDFASPEQLAGERPTVADDIYSFGKLARLILQQPSDRDIAAILDKATQPVAADRYASVHALAADLRAYLEHRPVAARKPRPLYRAGRWMRRHQAAASLAFAVALVLAASVTGVLVQTVRATRERIRAEKQLAEVVKLNGVLAGELYDSAKSLPQANEARATLLHTATGTLDTLSAAEERNPGLSLEIAQEYDLLAKLERDEDPGQRGVAASQRDHEKAAALRERSATK